MLNRTFVLRYNHHCVAVDAIMLNLLLGVLSKVRATVRVQLIA